MGILSFFFGRQETEKSAAVNLPDVAPPKVRPGSAAMPSSLRRSSTRGTTKLQETDRRVATTDLLTLRSGANTKKVIHDLAMVTPDLSASLSAYVRMVVTPKFSAIARNQDGTANPEATAALQQVLARFNRLHDYTQGYSEIRDIYGVAEALTIELRLYGSCALELVLDRARMPYKLQPISTTQIIWKDDGKQVFPAQQPASGKRRMERNGRPAPAVGELGDDDVVARHQSRLHRGGRDGEGLKDHDAQGQGDGEAGSHDAEYFEDFPAERGRRGGGDDVGHALS